MSAEIEMLSIDPDTDHPIAGDTVTYIATNDAMFGGVVEESHQDSAPSHTWRFRIIGHEGLFNHDAEAWRARIIQRPAPEPEPAWKPGTIGTAGTVRGLGYTGPVVRTDEHLLPWWTPSRVDGAHYHGEETVTDFVPDEPKVPNGVVIDPAAVDWRGLQSQMSVLVVGAEPFKRAGDILAVVRRELGIEATS